MVGVSGKWLGSIAFSSVFSWWVVIGSGRYEVVTDIRWLVVGIVNGWVVVFSSVFLPLVMGSGG